MKNFKLIKARIKKGLMSSNLLKDFKLLKYICLDDFENLLYTRETILVTATFVFLETRSNFVIIWKFYVTLLNFLR